MSSTGMMMRRIEDVGQHAWWFIALGVVFIVGGVIALAMPFLASIAAALVVGWVFIFVGVATLIQAWQISTWGGRIWQVIIGLIILAGGIVTIIDPISAAIGLTLLVGIVYLAKGAAQIVMGVNLRPLRSWGWVLAAGILAVLVGLIIIFSWPFSGTWVLGTLAGISLIFSGWAYIMMATMARQVAAAV
jgi:uncharacterized membrane protein HdeD (DUF308 family)